MQLVELVAENFKRLVAVRIRPGESLTPIVGPNGAGKTSVLDAIEAALGGADHYPEMPIRKGEEEARVVVDLGDIQVRRRWKQGVGGVKSTLEVSTPDGARYPSPQTVLNKLVGTLSFDPLEFLRAKPTEQAAVLARIAGLNLDEHASKRKTVFEERTAINRVLKTAEVQLAAIPPVDAPDELLSIDSVSDQLQEAADHNRRIDTLRADAERARQKLKVASEEVTRIANLLAAAQAAEEKATRVAAATDKAAAEAGEPVDVSTIRERLKEIESTNVKVRDKQTRAKKAAEVESHRKDAAACTSKIEAIDKAKDDQIAAAKLPVPGLSLSDSGVLLNGIPLSQCSGAERLRLSVAIGLALNPKLKLMLIRDGSLLDANGMSLVAEMAAAANAQVLIERVQSGGEVGVMIEDGEVAN